MKALKPSGLAVVSLFVAALVAAGCSGNVGGNGSLPATGGYSGAAVPASSVAHRMHPNDSITCPSGDTCGYIPLTTLSFNGSIFSEVPSPWPCFPNLWNTPVYSSAAGGPLVLGGSTSLAATCSTTPSLERVHQAIRTGTPMTINPCPCPTPTPSAGVNGALYIVAYPVGWSNWDRVHHSAKVKPDCITNNAVAVEGPATFNTNPWVFAPIPGALTMPANSNYVFFVAIRYQVPSHGWGW